MTFKAVIFDLDGTLLDTLQDLFNTLNAVLSRHGYPTHTLDECRFLVGHGMRELVRKGIPEKAGNEETIDILMIDIPDEWDNGDFSTPARVTGHEGRNRMKALQELEGTQHQEVHIFPRGLRNRHMTPEFLKNLNKWLMPERQEHPISGPFWRDVLNIGTK